MAQKSKSRSIVGSTLQITIAVLIIKIVGVLKQSIVAAFFGANSQTDVYFIATGVITSLCSVIFSAISISLLSMHSDRLIENGRTSSNNLINAVIRIFVPLSVVVALIFWLGSPLFAKFLAPSYTGSQLKLLSHYIWLMSPMFVFTCYTLIVNVTLETDKIFLPGQGQSFFQNLFICIAAIIGAKTFGIEILAYAFLLAGVAQCLQITWNARNKFKFKKHITSEKKAINSLLRLSFPLLIGNAIYAINDIVDKQVSTGLGAGNASFLSFGASINEMVTTLIVSSVSTVLFSHYATWVAEKQYNRVGENFKRSIEALFVVIMPVMIMCFVCGTNIVEILYGRGSFKHSEIISTSHVVYGYAAGFLFQALRSNLVRIFYAFQNTRIPMMNGAIAVALNIFLCITLSRFIGVGGISLATSISMFIVSMLLFPRIKRFIPGFSMRSTIPQLIRISVCSIVVLVIGLVAKEFIPYSTYLSLFAIGMIVIVSYAVLGWLIGINLIREGFGVVRKKLFRN